MMHRYVILVSTRPGGPSFARAMERLRRELAGWAPALDTDLAAAWVFTAAPSRLGHRRLGPTGCLIGRDFAPDIQDIDQLLDRSWGAYVAVSVDPTRRAVRVLRDPTGRMECWRLSLDGADVVFSHYDDVHRLQARPSEIDWTYLTHHLNQGWMHGEATCVQGITEVLHGEELIYADGQMSRGLRWRPHEIAARPYESLAAAQAAIRSAAETAVPAWARLYRRFTLDLSGGLDSAIVLGLLRGQGSHEGVIALNRVTPGEAGDERAYARDAAALHGVELVEQEPVSRDVNLTTPFARKLMRPRNRILPLGYDETGVETARRLGAEAYFTGTGGDHLFYDNLQANAACDYLHNGGGLREGVEAAVSLAQLSRDTVWGVCGEVARHYLRGRPPLDQLWPRENRFLTAAARAGADYGRYTHPWAVDAARYAPPAKRNQILFLLELQRHYYRYGRAEAAEEVHPLISQPLIEACLRTPAHWFGIGGVQRGLARRAFADLLPASIRNRRSKGGNGIYFIEFLTKRLPRIRELLLDGRLAENGLLDRARVETALTPLRFAAGEDFMSINTCLTTELWIRQTEADRAEARPLAVLSA